MANTIRTYTGDGVTTLFPIDFALGYLRRDHIYVYTTDYNTQLDYTWVNSNQIELIVPVEVGTEFNIRRIVPRDKLINNYEDGSILREKNLDDSHLQHLMLIEEVSDGFITLDDVFTLWADLVVKGTTTLEGDVVVNKLSVQNVLDMLSNRITNLATPSDTQDAVNKGYVDSLITTILQSNGVLPLSVRHTSDGVNNTYTTPFNDADILTVPNSYIVCLDGVKQAPINDYTVSGNNIVFLETPEVDVIIDIIYYEPTLIGTTINIETQSIAVLPNVVDRLIGDGVTTDYIVPTVVNDVPVTEGSYEVYLDGVKQRPVTDYSLHTSTTLRFIEAPADNTIIDITFYAPQIATDASISGIGSPEGVVQASVGTLYKRLDGGIGSTLYVKEVGTGTIGWSAK